MGDWWWAMDGILCLTVDDYDDVDDDDVDDDDDVGLVLLMMCYGVLWLMIDDG